MSASKLLDDLLDSDPRQFINTFKLCLWQWIAMEAIRDRGEISLADFDASVATMDSTLPEMFRPFNQTAAAEVRAKLEEMLK